MSEFNISQFSNLTLKSFENITQLHSPECSDPFFDKFLLLNCRVDYTNWDIDIAVYLHGVDMKIFDDGRVEQIGKIVQIPLDSAYFQPNYRHFSGKMLLSKNQFEDLLRTLYGAKQKGIGRLDIRLINLKSNSDNHKTITLVDSADAEPSEVIYFDGVEISNKIKLDHQNIQKSFLKRLFGID